jgi:hypothetical protein
VNISLVANTSQVGRNDYAANAGDRPPHGTATSTWLSGGGNYTQFGPTDRNTNVVDLGIYTLSFQLLYDYGLYRGSNGVVGATSELKLTAVEDGTSATIWVGEKYIPITHYDAGAGADNNGNDQGWDCGFDVDNVRWTMDPPKGDEWVDPAGGLTSIRSTQVFGSAHTTGCQFVFLDGSVRSLSYDVDRVAFHQLGNRSDGEAPIAAAP